MTQFDKNIRQKLEANLFYAAHVAAEPWEEFDWHRVRKGFCDTWKEHSSQALSIDLFGTIKVAPERDVILDHIAESLRLPSGGPWSVELEWRVPKTILNERRLTQVDAIARGARPLILFECKFTETDGGMCSQPIPLRKGAHKGIRQCNGNYETQLNVANGKTAKCALTGKGILYWNIIPQVFDYQTRANYRPCPFNGPSFQWMRNLVACWKAANLWHLAPSFVIVYADGPGLPVAERIHGTGEAPFIGNLKPEAINFRQVSVWRYS